MTSKSDFSPYFPPPRPVKPQEFLDESEEIKKIKIYNWDSIDYKDIPECDRLYFEVDNTFGNGLEILISCCNLKKVKNKNYEKKLIDYKELNKEYKKEYKAWKEQKKEYNKKQKEDALKRKKELFEKLKKELGEV